MESRIESTKNILNWNGEKNYRPNINHVSNTEHVNEEPFKSNTLKAVNDSPLLRWAGAQIPCELT